MSYYRKPKKTKKSPPPRQRRGDYRIFIGAFISGELGEKIQAIREQYDYKTSQITAPHVTLAGTYWRSGPATAVNESTLINILETIDIDAFPLTLGGIHTFGRRVVYLGVQPTDTLLAVRHLLIKLAGRDKHRKFKPHLTLAMRLKQPSFDQMVETLQESEWEDGRYTTLINRLHLMQRGPKDKAWRAIHEIPLKPLVEDKD